MTERRPRLFTSPRNGRRFLYSLSPTCTPSPQQLNRPKGNPRRYAVAQVVQFDSIGMHSGSQSMSVTYQPAHLSNLIVGLIVRAFGISIGIGGLIASALLVF